MKRIPSDNSLCAIAELAETEFALSDSPGPPTEDSSGIGDAGDSLPIDSVIADALFREFD